MGENENFSGKMHKMEEEKFWICHKITTFRWNFWWKFFELNKKWQILQKNQNINENFGQIPSFYTQKHSTLPFERETNLSKKRKITVHSSPITEPLAGVCNEFYSVLMHNTFDLVFAIELKCMNKLSVGGTVYFWFILICLCFAVSR